MDKENPLIVNNTGVRLPALWAHELAEAHRTGILPEELADLLRITFQPNPDGSRRMIIDWA